MYYGICKPWCVYTNHQGIQDIGKIVSERYPGKEIAKIDTRVKLCIISHAGGRNDPLLWWDANSEDSPIERFSTLEKTIEKHLANNPKLDPEKIRREIGKRFPSEFKKD